MPTLAEIGQRMDTTRQKLEVLAAQLRARKRASLRKPETAPVAEDDEA